MMKEFELPLKKTDGKKMSRASSGDSIDKVAMKKGPRTLSGENLLSMLKLDRTKRTKAVTRQ